MPLTSLTIQSIQGGALIEQINDALAKIGDDVIDRPLLEKARVVGIKIGIVPHAENIRPGQTENLPEIAWEISMKIPGVSGVPTRAIVKTTATGERAIAVNTSNVYGDDPRQQDLVDSIGADKDDEL